MDIKVDLKNEDYPQNRKVGEIEKIRLSLSEMITTTKERILKLPRRANVGNEREG